MRYSVKIRAPSATAAARFFMAQPRSGPSAGGAGPAGLARTRAKTVISTYGRDHAVASTLYHRTTMPGKVGRQMQTWVRFPEGWRVVAAHVSVIDEPK